MLGMRKRDVLGVALVSVHLSFDSFCTIIFSETAFVNVDKPLHNFKQTERYFSMSLRGKERYWNCRKVSLCDSACRTDIDIN
jgi:hypothetical protein